MDGDVSAGAPHASGKVLAALRDGVGLITFNQPEKRNAMSVEMWDGLAAILGAWERDPAVHVVVLTGAGDEAFVSGADISQFAVLRRDAGAQKEYSRLTGAGRAALASFSKPVIAQIRGFCLGGGLAVALDADIRIAAEGSSFGIPAAKLGIAYGFDMARRLLSAVGHAHASTLLLTGQRIGAEEAARIGLVNQVVPAAALDDTVAAVARGIAANAPLSVRGMKLILRQARLDPVERDMAAVDRAVAACLDSADYAEGRAAFVEKRRPAFRGT